MRPAQSPKYQIIIVVFDLLPAVVEVKRSDPTGRSQMDYNDHKEKNRGGEKRDH